MICQPRKTAARVGADDSGGHAERGRRVEAGYRMFRCRRPARFTAAGRLYRSNPSECRTDVDLPACPRLSSPRRSTRPGSGRLAPSPCPPSRAHAHRATRGHVPERRTPPAAIHANQGRTASKLSTVAFRWQAAGCSDQVPQHRERPRQIQVLVHFGIESRGEIRIDARRPASRHGGAEADSARCVPRRATPT